MRRHGTIRASAVDVPQVAFLHDAVDGDRLDQPRQDSDVLEGLPIRSVVASEWFDSAPLGMLLESPLQRYQSVARMNPGGGRGLSRGRGTSAPWHHAGRNLRLNAKGYRRWSDSRREGRQLCSSCAEIITQLLCRCRSRIRKSEFDLVGWRFIIAYDG